MIADSPRTAARPAVAIAVILLLTYAARGGEGPGTLFDFEGGFDFAAVEARSVTVSASKADGGTALRVASTHREAWPGITLEAPRGKWDLSAREFIEMDVANVGANAVTVCLRVDNPGADGVRNCNTGSVTLEPGASGTLRVAFKRKPARLSGVKLFGMRGYPIEQGGDRAIDAANVTQLLVFVPRPKADHVFEIDDVRAGGSYTPPEVPDAKSFFPMIDEFGQYIHRDWPGKVHSEDELRGRIAEEATGLEADPGPPGWNEYGGWEAGPALEATGFFRVRKHEGRWWLVDPAGRLFFSHGIDCVNTWGATPIEEREHWFRWLPGRDSDLGGFYSTARSIHYHYKGRNPRCFDFIRANLLRKYGPDWQRESDELAHRRLRSWGLNTIANWSDSRIYLGGGGLMRRTPYVATIHFGGKLLEGSKGYWGKFRDVFDADFERQLRGRLAREKGKTAGDRWCIGYFVDNEIAWGDEVSLAVAALVSPAAQEAKKVFVADLRAKYGTIAALNGSWGTDHPSWQALLESRRAPDKKKARDDLTAFYTKTAERYFSTVRDAVKEVAPNNLYLGCRFAWVNARAAAAAAKYCDVVSYNLYRRSVAAFRFPGGRDVPLIIGEFHFGALDRGMFHTGLVSTKSQDERARTYREYVRGVLRHPAFVGCHWFKYRDEPTTGRPLDAENYQIGFVDNADTPYAETIAACREVGYGLYEYRSRGWTPRGGGE